MLKNEFYVNIESVSSYIKGMKKSIYRYTDYREFLKDFYLAGKECDSEEFSFRALSRRFGFTSSNYFKLLIDKKRHLGRKSIAKVAQEVGLKKLEQEYFSHLVFFDKAKSIVERNFHYGQIVQMRSSKDVAILEDSQLGLYEQWYIPVIRELIVGKNVEDIDYATIANSLIEPIHHKQVLYAINQLLKLNLIVIKDGCYQQAGAIVDSGNEISSHAVKLFHKKMISFGSASIDTVSREKREISSVTMKVSEEGYSKIKERVQQFRAEILQMIQDDDGGDTFGQLNFQLFPLVQESDNE